MKPTPIFLYPGYITKGLKGRLVWHPKMPDFDPKELPSFIKAAVNNIAFL
jgi:hypothetical protein